MNFFEKFIMALKGTMSTPTNFGWFHLMFIAFVIIAVALLCVFARNVKNKTFRLIILISWIVILCLEIYKQLVFSYDAGSGWDYQWYAFPFQLCSTPLYLLPFVVFLKDIGWQGLVRDSIMAFLGTFVFFAGFAVFMYPNDVFISLIGINIQTMVHHGLQIVLGIYIMVYNRKKLNIMFYVKGIFTFLVMFVVALLLNIIVHAAVPGETFNMFYIGPYYPCTLPLLNIIYPKIPYVVFLILYMLGFAIAAIAMFYLQYLFMKTIPNFIAKQKAKVVNIGREVTATDQRDLGNEAEKERTDEIKN